MGGESFLVELLELALQALEHDIPAIAQHLHQGDAKGAQRLLHALKGSAPLYCCVELVQQITTLDALSNTASAAELTPFWAHLAPGLAQVHEEICVYLGAVQPSGRAL